MLEEIQEQRFCNAHKLSLLTTCSNQNQKQKQKLNFAFLNFV